MLTLQFWNSSFVPVYSELVPPGLAIEDVAADHSLAVQLLAKWLERLQSNDSQILSIVTMQDSRETNIGKIHFSRAFVTSLAVFWGSGYAKLNFDQVVNNMQDPLIAINADQSVK